MPSLENLHHDYKDEPFVLLAINVQEKRNIVQEFTRSKGLSFRFLLDEDRQVSDLYDVRSHPMKFFIDAEGNLVGKALGYREWDNNKIKSLINLMIDPNA